MTLVLKRSSLVAQVADAIRSEVLRGTWQEWIPSERELSRTLHVSRNTCRNGLHLLRRETLIEPVPGRGIRINPAAVRKASLATRRVRTVGIIAPEAVNLWPPQMALVVDELKTKLFDSGVRVELHINPASYSASPHRALEKLLGQNRHDCWILVASTEPIQRWFMKREIPCIVQGSVYPGIGLPSVDSNHRAVCRHAAGSLIALGHRRLVFLNRRARAAGDLESEAGFLEGVRASPRTDVKARIDYHHDNRETVAHLIQSLFAASDHPTGLLIANPYCYLSAMSALARRGLRIPDDVSLISRDNERFLAYVNPEPTRYSYDPSGFARKVMSLLRPFLEGGIARHEPVRIVGHLVSGGSCRAV